MGKGSTRRPLLISEKEIEDNWNKIFKKPMTHEELVSKMLENPAVAQALAEYELNKSTGEVEKRFKEGTSKPNESQFNGD